MKPVLNNIVGGAGVSNFENLLLENKLAVERFVKFKISNISDAEDILQEIYLIAFKNFPQLNNRNSF